MGSEMCIRGSSRCPRPLQPGDSGTAGDSGPAGGDSGKAPFKVPEDVATLFLAHKMLGVSAYRRFVAGMQLLAIRTFAHPSFNGEEANAGANMAYAAGTGAHTPPPLPPLPPDGAGAGGDMRPVQWARAGAPAGLEAAGALAAAPAPCPHPPRPPP